MRVEQILKDFEGDNPLAKLPKGHLNGVIVSIQPDDPFDFLDDFEGLGEAVVRAKHVGEEVTHLCTNIPLLSLSALSDIDNGSIGNITRAFTTGLLKTSESVASDERSVIADENTQGFNVESLESLVKNRGLVFYVDFGSIFCEVGSEFQIEIDLNGSGFRTSIYAVSREIEPYHYLKYDIDFDLNENHQNILRALLYTERMKEHKDVQIFVKSGEGAYDSDLEGYRALTQTFGKIEGISIGQTYEIYRSSYGVPADVWIKVHSSGSVDLTKGKVGVLSIRSEHPLDLATRKNIDILKRHSELVRKYETNYPKEAAAMIASGLMTPSKELDTKINELI